MKKLIALTAIATVLVVGSQGHAWAGEKSRQGDDDYRTFRKIVRVLDDLINDDRRGGHRRIIVRKHRFPKRKACYLKGPYEVCRLQGHGYGPKSYRNAQKGHYGKYSKRH